ncbi:penicillin-binding protein [Mumia sp. zg.B53]|uniref:penicillin-binding transpeptidase domain-containing protein n=1 Tax=Mumia sp. zg.B53 TaxID=2855449 RepID=UPI001C6E6CFB|nr:penicillin-binding transpeptidase domain-containing protein [Mumia sp. zg.B53]MBW9216365.1 penicillin-binding protein [Mumia sp. zg.B53]
MAFSPSSARHRVTLVLATVLGASVLGACSGSPAEPEAEQLAEGLSSLDLSGVEIDDSAAGAELTQITKGLDDLRPTVSVKGVAEEDETATATLAYRWEFGPDVAWEYETKAEMRRADDTWTVAWSPSLVAPDLAEGQRLRVRTVPAQRGDILGGSGTVLVTERSVQRIGIDKTAVPAARQPSSARALARILGIDADDYAAEVAAAGPKAFVEAIVLRAEQRAPNGDPESVFGARVLGDTLPLGPTRTFASAILGSVGEATKELIDKSDGRLSTGDLTGLSGLALRYDEQLRGRDGYVVDIVSDAVSDPANPSPSIKDVPAYEQAPVPGEPLRTTLDQRLQILAEEVLAGTKPASALVAIKPSTGAVLAAATGPGAAGQAIATTGQYAPGSTFKITTALAALRAGVDPTTTTPCPATTVVNGKSFKNYDDYPSSSLGRIRFTEAFAQSCNTSMIGLRDRVAQSDLASAAASLGMGVDQDLGFPSYFGSVPTEAPTTEHAASMIGQGKVLASPFTMATVTASVAAGRTVVPVLLPDREAPKVESTLEPAEARQLRALMRRVVTDGSGRALAGLGGEVGAKTGTAEYGSPVKTHAWMVATKGDLAVAVFVETGESGSQTAGPLLKRFLARAR